MFAFSKFGFNKSAALFLASIFFTGHASAQTQAVQEACQLVNWLLANLLSSLFPTLRLTQVAQMQLRQVWDCSCISIVLL